MKSIQIEDDLLIKLKFLKGFFSAKNQTDTIERILFHAGFNASFFVKMAEYIAVMEENDEAHIKDRYGQI